MKRLIALPGDWIQVPESSEILRIPEGHCWVEGDNAACSWDSRSFGPVSLIPLWPLYTETFAQDLKKYLLYILFLS